MNTDTIPEAVKQKIINEMILPSYERDISFIIRTRSMWSFTSGICTTLSTLLVLLSSILAFLSSGSDANLEVYSGLCGILSISLKGFASYADACDHVKTIEVNKILKALGINLQLLDDTKNSYQSISLNEDSEEHPKQKRSQLRPTSNIISSQQDNLNNSEIFV